MQRTAQGDAMVGLCQVFLEFFNHIAVILEHLVKFAFDLLIRLPGKGLQVAVDLNRDALNFEQRLHPRMI